MTWYTLAERVFSFNLSFAERCLLARVVDWATDIFVEHDKIKSRKSCLNDLMKLTLPSNYFTFLWSETLAHGFLAQSKCLHMLRGDSSPPIPEDIPEHSHDRVFREKFHSVYVVKGVWSLLTDLFLNRRNVFWVQA